MIELHWTRDEVLDQVDIPFLEDLCGAWDQWPPLRKFMAAYHGHKPKPPPSTDYENLLSMFPGGNLR